MGQVNFYQPLGYALTILRRHAGILMSCFFCTLYTQCMSHPSARTAVTSHLIRCHTRRDYLPDTHFIYNNVLGMLQIYVEQTKTRLYEEPVITQGSDPRTKAELFQICISSRTSLVQEVGKYLKNYLKTAFKIYYQYKHLKSNLVLYADSPLNVATNVLLNTLKNAVCKINPSARVELSDLDIGEVDGASFYQGYLAFVLNLSDFIQFVFQNVGKSSKK